MPAPKGNRFAAKAVTKAKPFGVRLSKPAMELLNKIMEEKKITASEVIEKLLLKEIPRQNKRKEEKET